MSGTAYATTVFTAIPSIGTAAVVGLPVTGQHVVSVLASVGVFVGVASIAGLRTKDLRRWMSWLGIVQATLAILYLVSLIFFPAALLILLGRMLGFVWCIAAGIVLTLRDQRGPPARG